MAFEVKRRFELLDSARGLAALAVVFFHRGLYAGLFHPLDWITKYGEVGANIFFVISGYVIYQSAEKYFKTGWRGCLTFLGKRFRRIYPTLWFSLLLAFPIAILFHGISFNWNDVLGSATLTYSLTGLNAPQVVYWTLVFEQQFYIFIAILILLPFSRAFPWFIIASSIFAIIHVFGLRSNWWMNSLLPAHWLEFELGILAYFILHRRTSLWFSVLPFMLLVLISLVGDYRVGAAGIFACILLIAYRFESRVRNWSVIRPFRFLGRISYSLYLTHLLSFAINDFLLNHILPANSFSLYLSGICSSLPLAYLFFLVFEKPFLLKRMENERSIDTLNIVDIRQSSGVLEDAQQS